jgi:OOP family OmpA-OmpF porin
MLRPSHIASHYRLTLLALAALGLAACSSGMDDMGGTAGTPFTQALSKDYSELSDQAANLPPPAEEESFWDSLNPFSGPDTSVGDALSESFAAKASASAAGSEPELEPASGAEAAAIRSRLARAIAAGKDQFPDQAARAQADYDCWMLYGTAPSAAAAAQGCRSALDTSLLALESAARPAPAPAPAPVTQTAPAAQAAPADYTVYFDFDSWTLTAEDLKVLTDVIDTARSGGQSHITVVGHTDTSGPADYNQRLSVHRANVVVEALVDMGARRSAIAASGVGESDLAVQTEDGVKEGKNRRAVIGLQP